MTQHRTGSREEWLAARLELLAEEKALTCYDRGTDGLTSTWQLLDRAPMGRYRAPEWWPRRHDEYEDAAGGRVRSPSA
jgi:predicted dithiol-disulfide oxidoreductase (DUF899 family)